MPSQFSPELSFSHVGFFVRDIERMEDFYTRLLGFAVSDRGQMGNTKFVFLTRDVREHHQIVMASGRPDNLAFNAINQISFRMGDFAGLREMYRAVQADKGVSQIPLVLPANPISVYFRHPDGTRIYLFVDTPWYVEQP